MQRTQKENQSRAKERPIYSSQGKYFGSNEQQKPRFDNQERNSNRDFSQKKSYGDGGYERKSYGDNGYERKSYGDNNYERKSYGDNGYERKSYGDNGYERKPYQRDEFQQNDYKSKSRFDKGKPERSKYESKNRYDDNQEDEKDTMRLNKFIAHAGVCSRREADELIKAGKIKINDQIVTELGYQVQRTDKVTYKEKILREKPFVYVLLNKPKDFITTTDDPEDRNTVMDLVAGACDERMYPVGRLDRDTTGLLLLTNDGELTQKLTHPSFETKKIYHVELNVRIRPEDFDKLLTGIELEDGIAKADQAALLSDTEIGIEIHSGKNRVIRRMFEAMGYEVIKLDRTMYAGLTKKEVGRGKWRFLTPKEVNILKYLM